MTGRPCWIGVDVGTSGCRAAAVDARGERLALAKATLPAPRHEPGGGVAQDPEAWWEAAIAVLRRLTRQLRGARIVGVCVDATSATLLLSDRDGTPLTPALMYNDRRASAAARRIAAQAPASSPARGATASLAKALHLGLTLPKGTEAWALHQADWIAGRLCGRFGISDWNNALKLGFDPEAERWPDWIARVDLAGVHLPAVIAPGTPVGPVTPTAAAATGLSPETQVAAGTTDSTAAAIAAGAERAGDAVTSLGSTLVLKILTPRPIADPERGVYSHRLGDLWLAGGASNSGGAVLRQFFGDERLGALMPQLRPERPTGLDYYPLPAAGERFPHNDPQRPPRLAPRPNDDAVFLQGLLEGIAAIEAAGYRLLHALGTPWPGAILTTGGGAENAAWSRIRERLLGIPVQAAPEQEAAYGSALLCLRGSTAGGRADGRGLSRRV